MLISATFAWFSDVASNKGNVITSGNLEISVIGYDENGDNPVNFKEKHDPIISEDNWEPGLTNTKFVKIENTGTLALKYELTFVTYDEGLQEALWYKITEATTLPGGSVPTFEEREQMGLISSDIQDGDLTPGESIIYRIDYGMNESAGNTYMDKGFSADIIVTATQTNDKAKVVKAYTVNDIETAGQNDTVVFMKDIMLDKNLEIDTNINLDTNGYTFDLGGYSLTFGQTDYYATYDIKGVFTNGKIVLDNTNGHFNMTGDAGTNADIVVENTYNGTVVLFGRWNRVDVKRGKVVLGSGSNINKVKAEKGSKVTVKSGAKVNEIEGPVEDESGLLLLSMGEKAAKANMDNDSDDEAVGVEYKVLFDPADSMLHFYVRAVGEPVSPVAKLAYLVINVADNNSEIGDTSTSFTRGAYVVPGVGKPAAIAGGDFEELTEEGDGWYKLSLQPFNFTRQMGIIVTAATKKPARYVENTLYAGESLTWSYDNFIKFINPDTFLIDWITAVDNSTKDTNQMRSIALANDSVYLGYIQTYNNGRDIHRHDINPPYDLLNSRGMSVVQPKGLAADDRGYIYSANRMGGGSYLAVVDVYNSVLEKVSSINISSDEFGGAAIFKDGDKYYLYVSVEVRGEILRFDVTDPEDIKPDTTFGTYGRFNIPGATRLRGLEVDSDGTIYVASRDDSGGRLYRISSNFEVTIVGVTRAMDVALYGDRAYVTSYNEQNSKISVFKKDDLSLIGDITANSLDGDVYTRGTVEGWSGIEIDEDGRIWLCDQNYNKTTHNVDRLLVSPERPW